MTQKKSAAFTLIELLVVLFIISIVITAASLYAFNASTLKAKQTAKTLYALLGLAQEQAILQPAVYSFQLNTNGFDFFQYQLANNSFQGKWQKINNDPFLHFYHLPNKITAQIILLNSTNQNNLLQANNTGGNKTPAVVFYNNGNFTPFVINIGVYQQPPLFKIIGNYNGIINLVELR